MKRIYLSLLIIFATVISVMGLAYAYFTSNAVTMTGITLATGTPSIEISASGVNYFQTITGFTEDNMYPGWMGTGHQFFLRNTSNGMTIKTVIPTISVAGTPSENWAIFKGLVQAQFTRTEGNTVFSTGWKTLDYWQTNADAITLPLPDTGMSSNGTLFSLQFQFPTGGNDVSAQGKQIDGMAWSFVGRTP